MSVSTPITGMLRRRARSPNDPPRVTATTEAPASAARAVDSSVSSVSPEKETASTRVWRSTKLGSP